MIACTRTYTNYSRDQVLFEATNCITFGNVRNSKHEHGATEMMLEINTL